MDSSSRPALLLVSGRTVGFAASFAIGIVLARLFDPAAFGTYKQFFLLYATLYGVLQLAWREPRLFVPRRSSTRAIRCTRCHAGGGGARGTSHSFRRTRCRWLVRRSGTRSDGSSPFTLTSTVSRGPGVARQHSGP